MWRLFAFLLTTAFAEELSTRVVVTFRSASYNTGAIVERIPENVTVVKQYGRRLVLQLSEGSDSLIWDAMGGESLVERVETDSLVGTSASEITLPWNLDPLEPYGMHLETALTKRNTSVVAILDSGLAAAASAQWRPVGGFCFISSPEYTNTKLGRNPDFTDPGDQGSGCPTPSWHGTKVASIIKAVAPNAKLSIMRVLGKCGTGFASDVTDAIVWAAGGGINGVSSNPFPSRVISMSLAGKGGCPTFMQSAINQAIALGATIVAAAGNAGANATLYIPGNCKGVLSIGASTRQGTLAAYSNWGETLAFSAPGGDGNNPIQVSSVGVDGGLVLTGATGTSFAVPHVAGVLLMLQAANMSLTESSRYIPFVECVIPGGVCGRILSYVDPVSDNSVQATQACIGSLSDQTWTPVQAGYQHGGDYSPWFYCNDPCFVTGIYICDSNGRMRAIQLTCSDGSQSPYFGYQSKCDGTTDRTTTKPTGFTGIKAYAGADINGVELQGMDQSVSTYGCSGCQPTYDMQCGSAPDGRKRSVIGIAIAYDTQWVHSFKFLCSARRCADGFYYSGGDCIDCNRCPSGQYASGCSGVSAGTCTNCVVCPSAQYQSGCGGTYAGGCYQCGACGAGFSFSGCSGGAVLDNHVCTQCGSGTYGVGGFTTCTNCETGKFSTSMQSTACSACSVCPVGFYEKSICSTTQDRQCTQCSSCGANQYRSGCTGISGGACSNCPSCAAGKYLSSCTESLQSCSDCPANNFCTGGYNPPVAWKVSTCLAGTYLSVANSATSDGNCATCLIKYYCPGGTAPSGLCPAGWYCSTDGKVKTQCPAGSYCAEGSNTFTTCDAGYYSATSGASSVSVCLSCGGGQVARSAGLTACVKCSIGTFSLGGVVSACTDCGNSQYQNTEGLTACKSCTTTSCAAGTSTQPCTATTDKTCLTCTLIANCKYSGNLCLVNNKPNCACAAGYQMGSASTCQPCPYGMFKAVESTDTCKAWKDWTSECSSVALGTRVEDSKCVSFLQPLPVNADLYANGWKCNVGFESQAGYNGFSY